MSSLIRGVRIGCPLLLTKAALDALPAHEVVEDVRAPVHALTDAGGDLIVVGHRGLHGLRALGSVSERVAHEAQASVLVVR